jgi:phospholipid transport system substrate-binding protein
VLNFPDRFFGCEQPAVECSGNPMKLVMTRLVLFFAIFAWFAAASPAADAADDAAAVTATTATATASTAIDTGTPDGLIRTLTADILQSVRDDPTIKQADAARLNALINRKILPYADFERTTRLAMGRGWAQATPDQRRQLVEQFQLLLIHTYAGATSRVGDQQVYVKPARVALGDTDAVVHTQVVNEGKAYPVDYRLEKTPAGWRIYDVNVLGVWLIQAYRQQFSDQISQTGVAGLLKFLVERNQQLTGAAQ